MWGKDMHDECVSDTIFFKHKHATVPRTMTPQAALKVTENQKDTLKGTLPKNVKWKKPQKTCGCFQAITRRASKLKIDNPKG